jgi:hypothetical protein
VAPKKREVFQVRCSDELQDVFLAAAADYLGVPIEALEPTGKRKPEAESLTRVLRASMLMFVDFADDRQYYGAYAQMFPTRPEAVKRRPEPSEGEPEMGLEAGEDEGRTAKDDAPSGTPARKDTRRKKKRA